MEFIELLKPGAIARAVDGADAVISALGPTLRRGATGTPVTDGRPVPGRIKISACVSSRSRARNSWIANGRQRERVQMTMTPQLARTSLLKAENSMGTVAGPR